MYAAAEFSLLKKKKKKKKKKAAEFSLEKNGAQLGNPYLTPCCVGDAYPPRRNRAGPPRSEMEMVVIDLAGAGTMQLVVVSAEERNILRGAGTVTSKSSDQGLGFSEDRQRW